jgi:DNA-binding MarR family transcriptional regulator
MTTAAPGEDEDRRTIDPLQLDLQLCFALYTAGNLFTRLYRPLLAPLGLTYPQYVAMMILWERSPQTVGDLCRRLNLDFGTLSPLFRRLETAGLVVRRRDPDDQRRVLIELTGEGRALRGRAETVVSKLRHVVPVADALALRAAVKALNCNLAAAIAKDGGEP